MERSAMANSTNVSLHLSPVDAVLKKNKSVRSKFPRLCHLIEHGIFIDGDRMYYRGMPSSVTSTSHDIDKRLIVDLTEEELNGVRENISLLLNMLIKGVKGITFLTFPTLENPTHLIMSVSFFKLLSLWKLHSFSPEFSWDSDLKAYEDKELLVVKLQGQVLPEPIPLKAIRDQFAEDVVWDFQDGACGCHRNSSKELHLKSKRKLSQQGLEKLLPSKRIQFNDSNYSNGNGKANDEVDRQVKSIQLMEEAFLSLDDQSVDDSSNGNEVKYGQIVVRQDDETKSEPFKEARLTFTRDAKVTLASLRNGEGIEHSISSKITETDKHTLNQPDDKRRNVSEPVDSAITEPADVCRAVSEPVSESEVNPKPLVTNEMDSNENLLLVSSSLNHSQNVIDEEKMKEKDENNLDSNDEEVHGDESSMKTGGEISVVDQHSKELRSENELELKNENSVETTTELDQTNQSTQNHFNVESSQLNQEQNSKGKDLVEEKGIPVVNFDVSKFIDKVKLLAANQNFASVERTRDSPSTPTNKPKKSSFGGFMNLTSMNALLDTCGPYVKPPSPEAEAIREKEVQGLVDRLVSNESLRSALQKKFLQAANSVARFEEYVQVKRVLIRLIIIIGEDKKFLGMFAAEAVRLVCEQKPVFKIKLQEERLVSMILKSLRSRFGSTREKINAKAGDSLIRMLLKPVL